MSKNKQHNNNNNNAASSSSSSSSHDQVTSLIKKRNDLSDKILVLEQQLNQLSQDRFNVDKEIQRIQFISRETVATQDPECKKKVLDTLEKVKTQFAESCKTPKEYDSDVPYKCSDDFADTHGFDDWTDQQIELFSSRLEKVSLVPTLISDCAAKPEKEEEIVETFCAGVENALRVLFISTEAITEMLETVTKIEGAETGMLLECRDNLMEHWHLVFGDETLFGKPSRDEEVDKKFTKFFELNPDFREMLVDQLVKIGKPFSSLVVADS